jgi:hypothetical protein
MHPVVVLVIAAWPVLSISRHLLGPVQDEGEGAQMPSVTFWAHLCNTKRYKFYEEKLSSQLVSESHTNKNENSWPLVSK